MSEAGELKYIEFNLNGTVVAIPTGLYRIEMDLDGILVFYCAGEKVTVSHGIAGEIHIKRE